MITTDRKVYLVQFKQTTTGYIVQDDDLVKVLRDNEKFYIDSIKVSETRDVKFKRANKADILRQFNFDTENILYLENHPYFKGVKYL